MYRRNSTNSPNLAYIVSVLPFVLVIFLYYTLYTIHLTGEVVQFYSYVLVVLLVIWMGGAVVYFADVLVPKGLLFFIFGGLAVSLFMLLMTTYNYLSSYSFTATHLIYKVMMMLVVVVALAVILSVLTYFLPGVMDTVPTASVFQEWMNYLRSEWRATPNYVFVLLGLEFLVILAYLLIPWLLTQNPWSFSKPNFNGILWLYKGQLMLSSHQEMVVATSNDLQVTNGIFAGNPYLKNYSVSMWVYMNPKDAQMTEAAAAAVGPTNLFYYGTQQKTLQNEWELVYPKPRVAYEYDYGSKKYAFLIYYGGFDPYRLYLENQKWHELVFVFDDNRLSLYVDGQLDKAYGVPTSMVEFTSSDVIVLGDKQGALYGAIANVVYYDHALIPEEVSTSWSFQKLTMT